MPVHVVRKNIQQDLILYFILNWIGNQCREVRIGDTCSLFLVLLSNLQHSAPFTGLTTKTDLHPDPRHYNSQGVMYKKHDILSYSRSWDDKTDLSVAIFCSWMKLIILHNWVYLPVILEFWVNYRIFDTGMQIRWQRPYTLCTIIYTVSRGKNLHLCLWRTLCMCTVFESSHTPALWYVKPVRHTFWNCCSCCVSGQCNTMGGKCYLPSSAYVKSRYLQKTGWLLWSHYLPFFFLCKVLWTVWKLYKNCMMLYKYISSSSYYYLALNCLYVCLRTCVCDPLVLSCSEALDPLQPWWMNEQ